LRATHFLPHGNRGFDRPTPKFSSHLGQRRDFLFG
jgi:hypothetical protein